MVTCRISVELEAEAFIGICVDIFGGAGLAETLVSAHESYEVSVFYLATYLCLF